MQKKGLSSYPLYDTLKFKFDRFCDGDNKALFVFISAEADFSYHAVPKDKKVWDEHDRIVQQRGGGYALMSFDLTYPFEAQFSRETQGCLKREGLNYFSFKPLVNVFGKTGQDLINEANKRQHKNLYATEVRLASDDSIPNKEIPKRQPFVPKFIK